MQRFPHLYELRHPKTGDDVAHVAEQFNTYLTTRDWNTVENPRSDARASSGASFVVAGADGRRRARPRRSTPVTFEPPPSRAVARTDAARHHDRAVGA